MIPILLYYSTHKCISISYGDYRLWFFNSVISYAHACFSDIKIFFFLKTHAIEKKKSKEHTIHRIFGRKILQRIWRNVWETWTVFIKICYIQNIQILQKIMHDLFQIWLCNNLYYKLFDNKYSSVFPLNLIVQSLH